MGPLHGVHDSSFSLGEESDSRQRLAFASLPPKDEVPPHWKGKEWPKIVSRAMIDRYQRKDGPVPPAQFTEAAARVLGVRFDWLAYGVGPRTEDEIGLLDEMPESRSEKVRRTYLNQLLELHTPNTLHIDFISDDVRRAFVGALLRAYKFRVEHDRAEGWDEANTPTLAGNFYERLQGRDGAGLRGDFSEQFAKWLFTPLVELGVTQIDEERFTNYALTAIIAARLAFPDGIGARTIASQKVELKQRRPLRS